MGTWLASGSSLSGGSRLVPLGHPFAVLGRWRFGAGPHDGVRVKLGSVGRGQSEASTSPRAGVMTCTTRDRPKPWERSRGLPWHPVECSDVMVAQRVVDELDLGSRGGHDADVAPAAGRHPVADATDPGVAGQDLHRLDRGPTDQSRTLFGDPAAVHVGVGLTVLGGQPGPAGQLRGVLEPGDVADLGDEDRTQDRPDPGNLLAPPRSRGRRPAGRG